MKPKQTQVSTFILLRAIAWLALPLLLMQCQGSGDPGLNGQLPTVVESQEPPGKQRGAHVFGRIDTANVDFLERNNIEWVTLVAWAGQDDFDGEVVRHHNGDSLRIRHSDSTWISRLSQVRNAGFKVFLKPHVWVTEPTEGTWRSDIFPASEENWALWKESYRQFILRYARIAALSSAEMYCVGTEFSRLSVEKPYFWRSLIREVRCIYSGKLTYAANWYNEYEKVPFWDELDYIGIQAYFPLADSEYPSVEELSAGWQAHLMQIEAIHLQYDRPVLFTVLGYKSTADGAISPWEWVDGPLADDKAICAETQANCYAAFFNTVWKEDWFAGVHIWQLRSDYVTRKRSRASLDFTPLGKLSEEVIAEGFE